MAKLLLKSIQIRNTPGVTILSCAKDTPGVSEKQGIKLFLSRIQSSRGQRPWRSRKIASLLLAMTFLVLNLGFLSSPAFADPGGGGPPKSPGLNISPPPTPTPTPTVNTAPTGSGDRLSLKKLLGDPNYDFSKLTLADAGKALLTVIDWAIALSGGVALIYIIWGGIQYLTAGGNEEQTKKGKTTITWAVIGLILIITSYAIVKYFSTIFGTDIPIQ